MDKGSIAEFASPADLLRDHKSKFYAVSLGDWTVDESEILTFSSVRLRAKQSSRI
jgi:hypothetical protein